MPYTREKWTAVEAITQAARLCTAVRAEMAGAAFLQKDDKSPVTVADFGAQALVCHGLSEEFPLDVIVAEEDAAELRRRENAALLDQVTLYVRRIQPNATRRNICDWIDAGRNSTARRFWTLDPIDGTKGFLRNDQYAVALALIEDGQVKVGALACPALPLDMNRPAGEIGVWGSGANSGSAETKHQQRALCRERRGRAWRPDLAAGDCAGGWDHTSCIANGQPGQIRLGCTRRCCALPAPARA
jgi:3'(2'), 5'-bisphosphate nucleotidase